MTFKKWFVFAVALCTLLPLIASATVSRVVGMGGHGANVILRDSYNDKIWPQHVIRYPNQAGAEFYAPMVVEGYDWGLQSGYVNWTMDDESVLKFQLDTKNERNFGYAWEPNPLQGLDAQDGGYNKLYATYARHLGDMTGGATLMYGGKSHTVKDADGEDETKYTEFGLRLGLTLMEEKLDLGLGFMSGSYSVDQGGETTFEADGASTIGINARYWWMLDEKCTLIPHLSIVSHTDGAKAGDNSAKWTESEIKLGLGDNWTPADNMLVIGEVGISLDGATLEQTVPGQTIEDTDYADADVFYWRIGSEIMVFEWLDARFGAQRGWNTTGWEQGDNEERWSSGMTRTYLGASCHWNRLLFDVLVDPGFVQRGPYFVSGAAGNLFGRASMTFLFNKPE